MIVTASALTGIGASEGWGPLPEKETRSVASVGPD